MAKNFNFQEWLSTGGEESHRNFVLGASYERMCWVRACIDRIATSASSAPLLFYKGSLDKINDFDELSTWNEMEKRMKPLKNKDNT